MWKSRRDILGVEHFYLFYFGWSFSKLFPLCEPECKQCSLYFSCTWPTSGPALVCLWVTQLTRLPNCPKEETKRNSCPSSSPHPANYIFLAHLPASPVLLPCVASESWPVTGTRMSQMNKWSTTSDSEFLLSETAWFSAYRTLLSNLE